MIAENIKAKIENIKDDATNRKARRDKIKETEQAAYKEQKAIEDAKQLEEDIEAAKARGVEKAKNPLAKKIKSKKVKQ